jgi:hypothetical protein
MLKRKRESDIDDINIMDSNVVWCPEEVAFIMQRLILRRYFSGEEADRCTICLEALEPKMAVYLPCKHAFHYKCWQHLVEQRTYTCPLCRANFSEALPAVGIDIVVEESMVILTIFTHMDLYDFMLELLWRNYENVAERNILERRYTLEEYEDDTLDEDDIFE